MARTLPVEMTRRGLLIPHEAIRDWEDIEIVQEERRIVIQPRQTNRLEQREAVIQALRENNLLIELSGEILSPPPTEEERLQLANKLAEGRPLSEIIIEERRSGW